MGNKYSKQIWEVYQNQNASDEIDNTGCSLKEISLYAFKKRTLAEKKTTHKIVYMYTYVAFPVFIKFAEIK